MHTQTKPGDSFTFLETFTVPDLTPEEGKKVEQPDPVTPASGVPDPPVETKASGLPDPPEAPTEPVATDTPDTTDLPGRTTWSNILLSLKEVDKLLPEDVDIPDNLDPIQMKETLYKAFEAKYLKDNEGTLAELQSAERLKLIEKGYSAEQIERALYYSEHMAAGGSEETVTRHAYFDSLANADVEGEEDEIELFRRLQTITGQNPTFVETHIDKELRGEANAEKRKAAAEAAKVEFGKIRDFEIQQDKLRAQQEQAQVTERKQKERTEIEKVIDTGFLGIKPTKEETDKLKKAMFSVASYRDVQTEGGIKRIPETAEAKAWRDIMSSPEKRVAFAYIAVFGIDKVMSQAAKQTSDSFIKAIEKSTPTAPTSVLKQPAPELAVSQGANGGFILKV